MSELTQFMLITAGTIFAMMSIVSAKLVIYILPCFGFLNYGAFLVLQQLNCKKFTERARKVVIYSSFVILIAVFVAGCMVSKYNYKIGYKEVCKEARATADEVGVEDFYYYDVKAGAGMDVFLNHNIVEITQEQFNDPQSLMGDADKIIIFAKEDNVVRYKLYLKKEQ